MLSEEHIIPEALGGRLTARFLCEPCNSSFGHRVEAAARSDPTIRLLANSLATEIPQLAEALSTGAPYVAQSLGGKVVGYLESGEFIARSTKNPDGSLTQDSEGARASVDKILRRQGYDSPFRVEALRRLDDAPKNVPVLVAPGLEVVNWELTSLALLLDGPLLDPVVPVKVAFEFLACHLGTAVYKEAPPLDDARRVLAGAPINPASISVERLSAEKARPFHGIVFENSDPNVSIQIRLFGKLALRVKFLRLAVDGRRFRYTHDLVSGEDQLTAMAPLAQSPPV